MDIDRDLIRSVLMGLDSADIRAQFVIRYEKELEKFVDQMAGAFVAWEDLASQLESSSDEKGAYLATVVYNALNSHVVSMHLLISGLHVPAGNAERHVLECIAMALLFSKRDLGLLDQFIEGEYLPHKAIRDVNRNAERLNLDKSALKTLKEAEKFYHLSSHASGFALASSVLFSDEGRKIILGGAFDEGKDFGYKKEIASRVSLSSTFPDLIVAVSSNWHS